MGAKRNKYGNGRLADSVPVLLSRVMKRLRLVAALLAFTSALSGCKPTFKHNGSMSVAGGPFEPVSCHVLATCTGIELTDATGARLELTLAPQRLQAWQQIQGTPRVRFEPPAGRAAVDFGACGSLARSGEGYHEPKGRAASGRFSLSCSAEGTAQGDLEFSGCF